MYYYHIQLYRTELRWNAKTKQCTRTLAQTQIKRTLLQAIIEGDMLIKDAKLRDRNQRRISLKRGEEISYKVEIKLYDKLEITKAIYNEIPTIIDNYTTRGEILLFSWDEFWEGTLYET